jgi:hypothetical protein
VRNFQRVGQAAEAFSLLHAIHRQPDLWNQHDLRRTAPGTPHAQVDDIWLRFQDTVAYEHLGNAASVIDQHESICYPAWDKLPQARPIIFNLMRGVEAVRLGRVIITRLPPGAVITPHIDGGDHARYYQRYQVCLQSAPGALFHIEGESVTMAPGEIWHIRNDLMHSVENRSAEDRIVMIVDLRCA